MNVEQLIKYFEDNPVNVGLLGGEFNPKAMAYIQFAQKAYDTDDFNTAIDYYTKALEVQPLNWHTLSQRAICYRMINDYDKSLVDAFKSKELDDNFENNQTIALCYLFKKNYENAVQYFDIAIDKLDKLEQLDTYKAIGFNYRATKARALNNQAVCYYNLKKLDQAVRASTQGINANPEYSNNYFVRGSIYFELSRFTEAKEDMKNALKYGDHRAAMILSHLEEN